MKNLVALLLVLIMTLCIGACSCGSDSNTATSDEVATTVATVDETTVVTTVADETTSTTAQTEATTVPADTKAEAEKPETNKPQNNVVNNNNSSNTSNKPQTNTEAKEIPVDNIDLRYVTLTLEVGESKSIAVTVYPLNATDRSYTVKANNSNVSVSSSGNYVTVTGKKAGSSKVTVTSNGKSAVCEVTVKKKSSPAPTQITLDTMLSHDEYCTDANLAKMTELVNQYFIDLGMQYTPSLNKDNAGWFVDSTFYSSYPISIRQHANEASAMFHRDFIALSEVNGDMFEGLHITGRQFRCYSEYDSVQKEYVIYMCHC